MSVPTLITELSTTAASNPPAGTDQKTEGDDHLRAAYAFIATLNAEKAPIASPTFTGAVTTAGQVVFPATQNASTNANTLDDYEEGSWTPTDGSGAGLSFTSTAGRYVKIGKIVHVSCHLTFPTTASGANAVIGGLPFLSGSAVSWSMNIGLTGSANVTSGSIAGASDAIALINVGGQTTNAQMSAAVLYMSGTYEASA